jgi:hypothetical protein
LYTWVAKVSAAQAPTAEEGSAGSGGGGTELKEEVCVKFMYLSIIYVIIF